MRTQRPATRGVQPGADGHVHQFVPGRACDLVDAVADPVVGAQHGRVLVGQPPQSCASACLRDGRSRDLASAQPRLAAQRVSMIASSDTSYPVSGQAR